MDCVKHMSQISTHLSICLFLAQIEKFPPKNLLGLRTAAEALLIDTWVLSIPYLLFISPILAKMQ